ncbi:hypothetical protein GQ42DRAFT_16924 [Ramicandelaber brevisporus]|nr:hypothetical protein GQ42DRAFT_16924 [Ramicandelaber brevisporus]
MFQSECVTTQVESSAVFSLFLLLSTAMWVLLLLLLLTCFSHQLLTERILITAEHSQCEVVC